MRSQDHPRGARRLTRGFRSARRRVATLHLLRSADRRGFQSCVPGCAGCRARPGAPNTGIPREGSPGLGPQMPDGRGPTSPAPSGAPSEFRKQELPSRAEKSSTSRKEECARNRALNALRGRASRSQCVYEFVATVTVPPCVLSHRNAGRTRVVVRRGRRIGAFHRTPARTGR